MSKMKVLLLCSKGGHLQEMMALRRAWERYDYSFVTFKSDKLNGWEEPHTMVVAPWDSIPKFIWTGVKVLIHTMFNKPDLVMSTGMGYFDIFMFPLCKLIGIKTIYIEGAASIRMLSGTGKMVKIFADRFIVRWETIAKDLDCEFHGGVF